MLKKLLLALFSPMVAVNTTSYPSRIPYATSGLTPDNSAMNGVIGAGANLTALVNTSIAAVPLGTSTDVTLTASQFLSGIWDVAGTPGGGVTLRIPTAAAVIAALPPTIPTDGQFNFQVQCLNDECNTQTLTVTAGTGGTILGTATVATNTCREYMVNVNVKAASVTLMNLGTKAL